MKKTYITPETETIVILNGQLLDETFSNSNAGDGYSGELDAKHNFDDGDIEEIQYNIWGEN
jgi:hypothetical protein